MNYPNFLGFWKKSKMVIMNIGITFRGLLQDRAYGKGIGMTGSACEERSDILPGGANRFDLAGKSN